MKYYVLAGKSGARAFENEEWDLLEDFILEESSEIFAWDADNQTFQSLLNMLTGWEEFIQLSDEGIKRIEQNTNIIIDWK